MAVYRNELPQLSGDLFIADGGIETDLIFHDGLDLPNFAAFVLFDDDSGRESLRRYFEKYARLAHEYGVGLVLETATWRSSADWGQKLGYTPAKLAEINREAVALLAEIRDRYANQKTTVVISGCIGPRGDGYNPSRTMTADEARAYHLPQVRTFSETDADLVTAITMNYAEEAVGIAQAAKSAGMPVVISFTVETDGHLPTGQPLREAIAQVDAATDSYPAYYMINCAHPTHFSDVLSGDDAWLDRIRGVRTNASMMSHAELDESEALDEGNPAELAEHHAALLGKLRNLNVLGGCCGTDHRHIEAICKVGLRYRGMN